MLPENPTFMLLGCGLDEAVNLSDLTARAAHRTPPSESVQRTDSADLGPTRTIRLDGPSTTTGGITLQPNEIAEVLNRPISQRLWARM